MAITTVITDPIGESTSAELTAEIVDEKDAAVLFANITTLTLTLYLDGAETIINLKDDTDILNANGGVVADIGTPIKTLLTLDLSPADNAMIGAGTSENHVALIEWTYDSGLKTGRHQVVTTIINIVRAP